MNTASSVRQPTLFIPHGGGPCFFMEWNPPHIWDRMADFLRGLAATLPARPRAVLLISGHWLEPAFTAGSHPRPPLIYDYYGFPEHTYQLRYDAPGDPALAARARELIVDAGLPADIDAQRGYDHGVFIPLKLVLPDADVPLVQLSLLNNLDAAAHLAAGRALAPLRDEGVLIVGSGMSFHNMRAYGDPRFGPVSDTFDAWLTGAVEAAPGEREARLARWDQAPSARLSHPPRAEEHLLPLMVAAGAAPAGRGRRIFSDRVMETTISGYRFD
ncbi:DODA-type extradiol aromatic ring-opening family dioxygenase [Solimonas soli]|uniref:DODA-type extradiol aromatic ring-opening family dioxygenase n=1 Tax=Solimonas soli TaxID=413479 RepID=UPI00047F16AD|nr:class III extradiol ring-cleavage dioxygenase [Solimonas soli]